MLARTRALIVFELLGALHHGWASSDFFEALWRVFVLKTGCHPRNGRG
jgi:hypothetical protein